MFKEVLEKHYGKKFISAVEEIEKKEREISPINPDYNVDIIYQVNFFISSDSRTRKNDYLHAVSLDPYGRNQYAEEATCGELEVMLNLADSLASHFSSEPRIKVLDDMIRQPVTNITINVDETKADLIAKLVRLTYQSLKKYREKIQKSL